MTFSIGPGVRKIIQNRLIKHAIFYQISLFLVERPLLFLGLQLLEAGGVYAHLTESD